jgi:hypothetical protein
MGHLAARLRQKFPETDLVFPAVKRGKLVLEQGQNTTPSTLAWIEGVEGIENQRALLPALPNILLAVVPGDVAMPAIRALIESVFGYNDGDVWHEIGEACWNFFDPAANDDLGLPPKQKKHWKNQLSRHWQCACQIWPLTETGAPEFARQLNMFAATGLGQGYSAEARKKLDPWTPAYQLVSHRLDARRNTRDFEAWMGSSGLDKDALSGREEAILDKEWLKRLKKVRANRTKENAQRNSAVEMLWHLFRGADPLAAASIVKRVWHRAYLIGEDTERKTQSGSSLKRQGNGKFKREDFNMPSVPGIAAFPWAVKARKDHSPEAKFAIERFVDSIEAMRQFVDLELPHTRKSTDDWLARVDWQYFQETAWEAIIREAAAPEEAKAGTDGLKALRDLRSAIKFGAPSTYYAVLAMDGDGMGRWLSGEKFGSAHAPGDLTREKHESISRGLLLASVEKDESLRGLVEDPLELGIDQPHPFQGKLIYAGADDVLAILPADQAVECARHIRNHFGATMGQATVQFGAVDNFTISAGIAIAHIKEPLQDMVGVAQDELKRAKRDLGGDAMAVRLFKRSGEQVEWAAKMDSDAFELLALFRQFYRTPYDQPDAAMPISGRFPHRLSALLRAQEGQKPLDESGLQVALAEFEFVLSRQVSKSRKWNDPAKVDSDSLLDELRNKLRTLGGRYAAGLRAGQRPIGDFYNLFNIEAFIARQGK